MFAPFLHPLQCHVLQVFSLLRVFDSHHNWLLRRFFPIWFRDGLLLGPVAASILQGLSPASIAVLSIVAQRLSTRIGTLCLAFAPSK